MKKFSKTTVILSSIGLLVLAMLILVGRIFFGIASNLYEVNPFGPPPKLTMNDPGEDEKDKLREETGHKNGFVSAVFYDENKLLLTYVSGNKCSVYPHTIKAEGSTINVALEPFGGQSKEKNKCDIYSDSKLVSRMILLPEGFSKQNNLQVVSTYGKNFTEYPVYHYTPSS